MFFDFNFFAIIYTILQLAHPNTKPDSQCKEEGNDDIPNKRNTGVLDTFSISCIWNQDQRVLDRTIPMMNDRRVSGSCLRRNPSILKNDESCTCPDSNREEGSKKVKGLKLSA